MTAAFEGWAVVELLGHRVRYGCVSEVTLFGEPFCRVDMPTDPPTFELYAGKSLYGLRPASEASIRAYHAPRKAIAAAEVVVDDDDWDDERPSEPPNCGGCGDPLGTEIAVRVDEDDDAVSPMWHKRCAARDAERVL